MSFWFYFLFLVLFCGAAANFYFDPQTPNPA
jgi:uncharacterized BrkB/YihY/UPF0761 family membrane protein